MTFSTTFFEYIVYNGASRVFMSRKGHVHQKYAYLISLLPHELQQLEALVFCVSYTKEKFVLLVLSPDQSK